jgi:hypothetical protein
MPTIPTLSLPCNGPAKPSAFHSRCPAVKALDEVDQAAQLADESVARSGETQRQGEWRDELLKSGIRGRGGQRIWFSRVEPLPGTRWLHADAETKEDKPQRVVASFGPEHAPMEQRQVALAIAGGRGAVGRQDDQGRARHRHRETGPRAPTSDANIGDRWNLPRTSSNRRLA